MKVCVVQRPAGAWSINRSPKGGPAMGLGHVCFQRSFVNEHKPFRVVAHERLPARGPDRTILCDIGPRLCAGAQVFFVSPRRCDTPQTAER